MTILLRFVKRLYIAKIFFLTSGCLAGALLLALLGTQNPINQADFQSHTEALLGKQTDVEKRNHDATLLRGIRTSEDDVTKQTLRPDRVPWSSAHFFPRSLTRQRHQLGIRTLTALTDILNRGNVTYIMSDGTLLGSYLAHGLLAWDDDFDIAVKYSDIFKVRELFRNQTIWEEYHLMGFADDVDIYDLKSLSSNGSMEEIAEKKLKARGTKFKRARIRYYQFKFYPRNGYRIGTHSYRWPFIDVKYYNENDTHVWTRELPYEKVEWRRRDFYPLHHRPFESLWLPAPKDTRSVLFTKYKTLRCKTHSWDHVNEVFSKNTLEVVCDRLTSFYPFVWRVPVGESTVVETLIVGTITIHRVNVHEPIHTQIAFR